MDEKPLAEKKRHETVRYPFVDVDGLELTIDAEGRVTRCRYSRLGAPEESVDRTCD